ncbi:MAG: CDP-alcohol phosphatidyltransferase family protein [Chitinophagales bacterium]|nr:CDP-alcohol phosphatidyltransferase family protein [Chitinophagales bacterium]MCZ2393934.1 CDP-alcohol phosphatidyltransferase family protein [Chitinophagales bacterium]
MIQHIPNMLTLLNLFSGSVGVYACATANWKLVPICIIISLTADFFDGLSARILKVKSALGAQIDSLADMVSFGLLPGMMFVQLIGMSSMRGGGSYEVSFISYLGFIFTLFAALRLAKFNIDTRQSDSFLGLATPAATIFVLGLYLFYFAQNFDVLPSIISRLIFQTLTLFVIIGVLSFLMISEIPMFALKKNIFKWKGNEVVILFLIASIVILFSMEELGLSVVIILYIIFSVIDNMIQKAKLLKN